MTNHLMQESHHALMLDVARAVIELRAARDGHLPNAYDTENDPEGYVTSLLNALHQWCHRHGIDWHKELARAQGFFQQDVAESQPGSQPLPAPTVQDLRCPKCGQKACFVIEVSECLLMFAEGVVLHGDTGEEWGDWSYCRCHKCQYMGTVFQFRKTTQERR